MTVSLRTLRRSDGHFCGLKSSSHPRHLIGAGRPQGDSGRHSCSACALLCCLSPRGRTSPCGERVRVRPRRPPPRATPVCWTLSLHGGKPSEHKPVELGSPRGSGGQLLDDRLVPTLLDLRKGATTRETTCAFLFFFPEVVPLGIKPQPTEDVNCFMV